VSGRGAAALAGADCPTTRIQRAPDVGRGRREVTKPTQRARSGHTRVSDVGLVIELTPSQKGAAAEAAITAMTIGLVVLRPLCEGSRYDLAIDLEPELLRVQ
jgi:hypothetical protein